MMTILSQRKRGWGANYFGAKTQLKQVLGVGLLYHFKSRFVFYKPTFIFKTSSK
jgi:hypothetical protein